MNTTQCPTKPAATEDRDASGKFLNHPGPGRPSKKLIALHERHKRATIQETCEALQQDIPNLEQQLADLDAEIADRERKFLEQIGPTVKHRSEVGVELSRARVAVHYLGDPIAFGGLAPYPGDVAKDAYDEVRRELEDAQRKLADTPDPHCTRVEALADADKWTQLHEYESARDSVDVLLGQEARARQTAEACGCEIAPLGDGPSVDGDPFTPPRVTRREMVANV